MQEVGDVTPGLCSLHVPVALMACLRAGLLGSTQHRLVGACGCFDYAKAFDCVDHNKL